ncbi:hypothetical protein NE865_01350 [Phthorimaea operculella]|nr:hypothetical protein NE865_01350 [Phthorimaea operculella]
MTQDLSFKTHITEICSKAFRNLGFILRQTCDFDNVAAVKSLYNALVRSRLEFGAMVWNPHQEKYTSMVEKLQNKFARALYLRQYGVYPFYPLMYPTMFVLGMVGYYQLEVRRNTALTLYVYKIFRGKIINPQILESLKLAVPSKAGSCRRSPRIFAVPTARTNVGAYSPLARAARAINCIAQENPEVDVYTCSPLQAEPPDQHMQPLLETREGLDCDEAFHYCDERELTKRRECCCARATAA